MGRLTEEDVARRLEAVLSVLRREEPAGRIAVRSGISEQTLYRLRDVFVQGGKAALLDGRGKGDPREREMSDLRRELEERDRVIGELTIANRILKKTAEGLL